MKTINKILIALGILGLFLIVINLYIYFSHPFIIKITPISQQILK